MWYLDSFEYAELNGSVHFFCFIPEAPFLLNKGKQIAIFVSAILRE